MGIEKMVGFNLDQDCTLCPAGPSGTAPDRGLAVGAGASIVLAVAAAIALVLATLIASLSAAGGAAAATLPGDGTFTVASVATKGGDSLAPVIVLALIFLTWAATAKAWRGVGARVLQPTRPGREPRRGKPARGR